MERKIVRRYNNKELVMYYRPYADMLVLHFIPEMRGNGFLCMLASICHIYSMNFYHEADMCMISVSKLTQSRIDRLIFCLKAECHG